MAIYIPEEHYVGFNVRTQSTDEKDEAGRWTTEDVTLGFATPVSSDAAFKKRKATVDQWSKGYRNKNADDERLVPKIFKNELADGFEVARSVRRSGWNGGNVVWRIVDPRGFELEISSSNFASIVDCTTIVNGVIQGRCVWGRDGSTNVLLPENSEPYQEFVKLTQLKNKVKAGGVGIKDIKPGYVITLESGDEVEYLGKFYCYKQTYDAVTERDSRIEYTLYNNVVERFMYKKGEDFLAASRLKIAGIVNSSNVTNLTDNMRAINEGQTEFIHVSINKPTSGIVLELVPADMSDVVTCATRTQSGYDKLYIGRNGENHVTVGTSYLSHPGAFKIQRVVLTEVGYGEDRGSRYGYAFGHVQPPKQPATELSKYEWFKVVVRFDDGGTYEPSRYYYR